LRRGEWRDPVGIGTFFDGLPSDSFSETIIRGTGYGKPARPDLWGSGEVTNRSTRRKKSANWVDTFSRSNYTYKQVLHYYWVKGQKGTCMPGVRREYGIRIHIRILN